MPSRASHERAYWDEVYRTTGLEYRKYLWTKRVEGLSYINECFLALVRGLRQKRILSLGGGVDQLGLQLAKAGNEVVTVDVSPVAAAATAALARQAGVTTHLTCLLGTAEDVSFDKASFDVVICKRALHHMELRLVTARAHDLLVSGGIFVAEEPICLLRLLRWVHQRLPFHPDAPRTAGERELTAADLACIEHTFSEVTLSYFDLVARESVAYLLCKGKMELLLRPLGQIDYLVLNRWLPVLRYLSTYAIIRAVK